MTREQEHEIIIELEKVHIEEPYEMPTFRNIPLREFTKEQLIKIYKLSRL